MSVSAATKRHVIADEGVTQRVRGSIAMLPEKRLHILRSAALGHTLFSVV